MITIGGRLVGPGHPCLCVAELGVNHNGSTPRALEMVRAAAAAGADAVKVQCFSAASFCTEKATYQGERQIDLFRRYELAPALLSDIADECKRQGVIFFGTPASMEQARILVALGAPCIKVGSDDLDNVPLLRQLAQFRLPMILSTGMASASDIGRARRELVDIPTVWLHCVSCYPTRPEDANIARVQTFLWRTLGPIGYSDHTDGIEAAVGAVWAGAVLLEKHFTLSRDAEGPDHAFSADPPQFAEMVRRTREAEKMRGSGEIEPSPEELAMRVTARRSIVAAQHIPEGAEITEGMLAYKRPGDGLRPWQSDLIVGKRATRMLMPDEQLREGDWV